MVDICLSNCFDGLDGQLQPWEFHADRQAGFKIRMVTSQQPGMGIGHRSSLSTARESSTGAAILRASKRGPTRCSAIGIVEVCCQGEAGKRTGCNTTEVGCEAFVRKAVDDGGIQG